MRAELVVWMALVRRCDILREIVLRAHIPLTREHVALGWNLTLEYWRPLLLRDLSFFHLPVLPFSLMKDPTVKCGSGMFLGAQYPNVHVKEKETSHDFIGALWTNRGGDTTTTTGYQ